MLDPWHLPGLDAERAPPADWWEGRTASGARFRAPSLSALEARLIAERVRESAFEACETRKATEVIDAVAAAAMRLVGEGEGGREACSLLRTELGWDARLSRETLTGMSRSWTSEALRDLVRAELGDPSVLDGFVVDAGWKGPGRRLRRARGSPLLLQILAGNVPGVAVTAAIRALIARSGVLCKVAEPEPGLLELFARRLAEVDPLLGRCIAVTWWPGGEFPPSWIEWAGRAGRAVVYGGETAVREVRRRPETPAGLVVYGPGLGVAVILPDAPEDATRLARDVLAYDQQGCVSPRLVYVVARPAGRYARHLAAALAAETARRAPPDPTPEEAVAIRSLRAEFEFGSYGPGKDDTVLETPGDDLTWTVLASEQADVRSEALPRVVRVCGVPDLDRLADVLLTLEGRVQTLGYAGTEGLEALAALGSRIGVSRVAPLGSTAWPPADWRHEGRHQLLPLLDWTDFETQD